MRTLAALSLTACLTAALITGCESTPTRTAVAADHEAAMLGPVAALAGEWTGNDPASGEDYTIEFNPTANNSAVREIMFPGTQWEMTNLYHMDGNDLVITHYCAAGNQPRMVTSKAKQTAEGTVYHFDLESVSNLRPEHDHYMGNMTLIILNDGTLREEWRSYQRDGSLTEPTTFVMTRK
ncbi:MAG: hypothetical protein ACF8R9_09655 [Phycisphaerales bacterium JB054]